MLWMPVQPGTAAVTPEDRSVDQVCEPFVKTEGESYRLKDANARRKRRVAS